MRKLLTFITFLVVSLNGYAATYYIDPSQTDPSEDGSIEHPFDSWDDVSWAAGNTYLQKRGTSFHAQNADVDGNYACVIVGASGTSDAHITLGAYGNGADPIITGMNESGVLDAHYGVLIFDQSYIDIENFTFTGCLITAVGIRAYNSPVEYVTVSDSTFSKNGRFHIRTQGTSETNSANHVTVSDCNMEYAYTGTGWSSYSYDIDIYRCTSSYADAHDFSSGGSGLGKIERINYYDCIAHDAQFTVAQWASGQSYTAGESRVRVVPEGHYICIQSHTSSAGNAPSGAGNVYWYRMLGWYLDGEGIGFQADLYSSTTTYNRCIAYNNYLGFQNYTSRSSVYRSCYAYNNTSAGIKLGADSVGDLEISNCTLTGNGNGVITSNNTLSPTLTMKNTILANNAGYGIATESTPWITISESYNDFYNNGSGNYQSHTINGTDLTSNPLLTGYEISSSSPCRDAGATTAATTDILGYSRPVGAAYDIGAFEYGGMLIYPSLHRVNLHRVNVR